MTTDSGPKEIERSVPRALDVLQMSPDQRHDHDLRAADVQTALRTVVAKGDRADKQLGDITLPAITYESEVLDGENNHPVDLTGATIESLDVSRAGIRVPLHLDEATIGDFRCEYTRFEHDVSIQRATVGSVQAHEATFDGNAEFSETTIMGPIIAREADFENDVSFDDVTFEGEVVFDAAELYGDSNRLDDNTSFRNARFIDVASFCQTTFEFTDLEGATFEADAIFTEAVFDGDADFTATTFHALASFDESRFLEDTSFAAAAFGEKADFRGATFRGGAHVIKADATFENATFEDEADFFHTTFRAVNFETVSFESDVTFEAATLRGDADFAGATFEAFADFDEADFRADADFTDAHFEADCDFRGAEFHGRNNHLDVAATFRRVAFDGSADFDNTFFTTAVFDGAIFSDLADFRGAVFEDEFTFAAKQRTNEAYVNFTGARLKDGTIRQPAGSWVRYDLTAASVGDLKLAAGDDGGHKELLDYFRFCETEFNEFDGYNFDFSKHTDYLDRNNWVLHDFDDTWSEYEPAIPMTPETIERTYLKAKIAASSVGNQQAAGEFRVKRQAFARRKYWAIVRDDTESLGTRLRNAARASENLFLGVTCGHGLRLSRIIAVFALFPLLPALLYTFGGPAFLATDGTGTHQLTSLSGVLGPDGLSILYENLYFSYITYLTIGYGGIGPAGWAAKLLAGVEVYISVVLGGLVLYALIKRSEV